MIPIKITTVSVRNPIPHFRCYFDDLPSYVVERLTREEAIGALIWEWHQLFGNIEVSTLEAKE